MFSKRRANDQQASDVQRFEHKLAELESMQSATTDQLEQIRRDRAEAQRAHHQAEVERLVDDAAPDASALASRVAELSEQERQAEARLAHVRDALAEVRSRLSDAKGAVVAAAQTAAAEQVAAIASKIRERFEQIEQLNVQIAPLVVASGPATRIRPLHPGILAMVTAQIQAWRIA